MPKHMFLPHPIHLDSYPNMYFSKVSTNPNMFTEPPSTSPNMSIRPSPNNLPKHWSLISNNVPKHVFRTQITYPSMQKPNNEKTERISTHVCAVPERVCKPVVCAPYLHIHSCSVTHKTYPNTCFDHPKPITKHVVWWPNNHTNMYCLSLIRLSNHVTLMPEHIYKQSCFAIIVFWNLLGSLSIALKACGC